MLKVCKLLNKFTYKINFRIIDKPRKEIIEYLLVYNTFLFLITRKKNFSQYFICANDTDNIQM